MSRKVHQGKFQYTPETGNTLFYSHDELLPLRSNVLVKISPLDLTKAFVFHNDQFLCVATPDIAYSFLDPRGAQEKTRRAKMLRTWLTTKKQDCDRIDLVDEMSRYNDQQPAMPQPNTHQQIELNAEQQLMIDAAQQAQNELVDALNSAPMTPAISQWGIEEDPVVVASRKLLQEETP